MSDGPELPPAGWRPDPERPNTWRYWDGSAWTDHLAPMEPEPGGERDPVALAKAGPPEKTTPAQPGKSASEQEKRGWRTGWTVALVIGVIILIAALAGGGEEDGDDGSGSSAPAQPEPPFTKAKLQGNCPGFMVVGLPVRFNSRITNSGSEDWPSTFIATDDFGPFVVNSVTLDGAEGKDPAPPGYDAYRFRGLNANETAKLSVDLTPKDAGNTDLEFSVWGDDPGASGIPEGKFLYGCTDLAIQP
jgi:Protein of unknown function (DUF2510)